MMNVYILIIPVVLDFIIGDPQNWPHPIKYMGKLIAKYEKLIRKINISKRKGGFVRDFALDKFLGW